MQQDDRRRWDARYASDLRYRADPSPHTFLTENIAYLPVQGLALDAATGLGANAAYLLAHGLRVVGADVSGVALCRARRRFPGLMLLQADLTCLQWPVETFDVILNFYYLERSLWPLYQRWLKPGGILVIETLTTEMRRVNPDIAAEYLLAPGELLDAFAHWRILASREAWIEEKTRHTRPVASLIAEKVV